MRSGFFFRRAGFDLQARDGGDGRQRFSAKAQGGDGEQVVAGADFRSGVAFEGEESIVTHHAAAVVGDLDELAAPAFDFKADVGGSGVERVLQHFLDHGGGTVDDLASGDLVGNLVGEYADAAHFQFSRYQEVVRGARGAKSSELAVGALASQRKDDGRICQSAPED